MVSDSQRTEFITSLNQTFKQMGVDEPIKDSVYKEVTSIYETKRDGILLSQTQLKALVNRVVGRILSINGVKTAARLQMDQQSLTVEISDNIETKTYGVSDFKNAISNLEFHNFYTELN